MGKNISTIINNHIVELRDCVEVLNAVLYIDGKKIGNTYNDGYDGPVCVDIVQHEDLFDELNEFLQTKKEYCVCCCKKEYLLPVDLYEVCEILSRYAIDYNKKSVRLNLKDK